MDSFQKKIYPINLDKSMGGFFLCGCTRKSYVNWGQWTKPQAHLKMVVANRAMKGFVVAMLNVSRLSSHMCLCIGSLGKEASIIKSNECLAWQCRSTLAGEVEMSLCSATTLSTYFCCRDTLCKGLGCHYELVFTFIVNHEEGKFPSVGDYLPTLLGSNQRDNCSWNYLWYPVELSAQNKNETTTSWIIYNMMLPHI